MNIVGMLSWYDERPSWLAGVVASLQKMPELTHLVALDGAFALYPDGRPRSDSEQHSAILEACAAIDIGCTLGVPGEVWFGNEVEKRNRMLELALDFAEPGEDWLFIVDADHFLTSAVGYAKRLADTSFDAAHVRLTERYGSVLSVGWFRGLFRAQPLRYHGNHATLVDSKGCNVNHVTMPVCDLPGVEVEHRTATRDHHRRQAQRAYYERRDRVGAETAGEPVAAIHP